MTEMIWYILILQLLHSSELTRTIRRYEILHSSNLNHHVVKRGLTNSPNPFNKIKEINFYAHNRNFRLMLTPTKDVIHHNFEAFEVNKDGIETKVHIDHDENVYHGRVFGAKDSKVHLHHDNGVLTGSIKLDDEIYHIEPAWRHLPNHDNESMITFKESDIEYNKRQNHSLCGYIKEGTELEDEINDNDGQDNEDYVVRSKRQITEFENPDRTRCPLLLVADYRFFREMGASNTKTTINYLISLIDRVHKIYNDTNWTDRKEFDGIKGMGFIIKKIVVHSEPTETVNGGSHYNMFKDKWDVRNLLEVFSREHSHKDFCLAHLFTDLKFEGGILGLAYVGSPRRNSVGGICTPEYFKNGYTLYLNSGLSSSRNHYGQRVITREADLVTAHEFGHNWGSEHDPDITECSPGASQGGSYLMYTYSVSGYDINNKKFSPCSLRSIRRVLVAKSEKCFSQQEESFCGNLRVEGNEQCDAGILGSEDNDQCCNTTCHLRFEAKCSDKNSPCCQNCQFMPAGAKCRDAQMATCERESRCTGLHAECPKSPPMPDDTECIEKGLCKDGRCIPYCETLGHRSCMCDKKENACKRCCRGKHNNTCFAIDNNDILPDGTPCFQGFCNHGVCERTIQDVVERFWNIIDEININTLLMFLRDNIVFTVVVVTACIWIPSSCLISYIDRKQLKAAKLRRNWQNSDQLISPSENRRIVYIKVPRRSRVTETLKTSDCGLSDYQL